ncbi:MAG: DUF4260 domain-containing protein [Gemmatimonadales bacterium]
MIAPKVWLRLEGGVVLVASVIIYREIDAGWLLFVLLFLVPDVSFAGYLGGNRIGALVYNLVHTYLWPVLLLLVGFFSSNLTLTAISFIWVAHIGFDRMLGFGLKYETAFADTHLNQLKR